TINLSNGMAINISETGISPDGAGFSSGTQLGNFLVILSNDTNTSNVTSHILRLYFDVDPTTYSGGVAIYYYNTATSSWVALTTTASGIEGGRYFIEAAPNHFSTFALLGTTTTGGGGGTNGVTGGGGGGYSSVKPTPAPTSTGVAPTPTTAVISPTTTPPQPVISVVPTPTAGVQPGGITGILLALLGFALPAGEGGARNPVLIIALVAGILAVVMLRIFVRRKR
ncbi:MAG: hypothetical protein O8C64_02660, partial [Candidatus Methanoperedens sp.]|nr:hypothetical protein [Candidatus Methanoperedens sp.]